MLDFLTSGQEFDSATTQLHQVFRKDIDIIKNPFTKEFTIFKTFEFDRLYGQDFYQGLINFSVKRDTKGFTFYTLLPDPVKYFFSYFSKYSIAKIPIHASHSDFWDFLNADPGNPADALMDNAETIALYSSEPIWGIIGSKEIEIGIAGFKEEKIANEFFCCFNDDFFMDMRTRFNDLNNMLSLQPDTKIIHAQMIENYSR